MNPSSAHFISASGSDGENVAFLGAAGSLLHQDLMGTSLNYGFYSFSFDVGNRMDQAFPDLSFNFLVNATTIIPLHSSNTPIVPQGEFRTWTFNYAIGSTFLTSLIGDSTRIRFLVLDSATGGSTIIDNIQGTFTAVPEPSSLTLCVLGCLGMTVLLRQRRSA